jgi:RNA recognition motif-containing protein
MDRIAGVTKGCGFVHFEKRAEAEAAIAGLDGKVTLEVKQRKFSM